MKNMMKILALGLFVAGSVVFAGCGDDTKADPEKKKQAQASEKQAETSANADKQQKSDETSNESASLEGEELRRFLEYSQGNGASEIETVDANAVSFTVEGIS